MPRSARPIAIRADFNALVEGGVRLCTRVVDDLVARGIELHEGLFIQAYEPDIDDAGLEAYLHILARLRWDAENAEWVACFEEPGFHWTSREEFRREMGADAVWYD